MRAGDGNDCVVCAAPRGAQGPLAGDLAQELGAGLRVAAGQVGFVIVRRCRQVGVLFSQVELLAVLLEGVVLEDPVGHVAVAFLADLPRPPLAQQHQIVQLAEALLHSGIVVELGAAEFVRGQEHLKPHFPFLAHHVLHLAAHLAQFGVAGLCQKIQLNPHGDCIFRELLCVLEPIRDDLRCIHDPGRQLAGHGDAAAHRGSRVIVNAYHGWRTCGQVIERALDGIAALLGVQRGLLCHQDDAVNHLIEDFLGGLEGELVLEFGRFVIDGFPLLFDLLDLVLILGDCLFVGDPGIIDAPQFILDFTPGLACGAFGPALR